MPNSKYEVIYKDLKAKIESNEYTEGEYLPSENKLTKDYDCSRNTVRRAITYLINEGYVQAHHGKGVRVIYSSDTNVGPTPHEFISTGMEGYSATVKKYGFRLKTKVITFTTILVNEHIAKKTGFPMGIEIYFVQRVRSLNGIPKMIDSNFLRKDVVNGLTKEIAEKSLFAFYEQVLHLEITTIKREVTIERTTLLDEKYLRLDGYNCLAVLTSKCYNKDGRFFEYTESRNRPDIFKFSRIITKTNSLEGAGSCLRLDAPE